jgi:2,3-bisphosphoglycerate-independent phosphoglycerate mutase
MSPTKKAILVILDGYGKTENTKGNAISLAKTPYLDYLEETYPHTLLKTDSEAVGLPPHTMGGSEVGHYTMGAGQIIRQSLPNIDHHIETGDFFQNEALLKAIENVQKNDSSLHLLGMLSDAGIHSHIRHLFALLDLVKQNNLEKVFIHVIADGRDVAERSLSSYIALLENKIEELGLSSKVKITDIIGRYYAMDRDENWDRTKAATDLYTQVTNQTYPSPLEAIKAYCQESEESDYYFTPKKIGDPKQGLITEKDSIVFFNYRTDRAVQLTQVFVDPDFTAYQKPLSESPNFVCFGEYSNQADIAFTSPKNIPNLGKLLSQQGLKQLRISETEKFPHVTFFFNSQEKEAYPGEDRMEIPSPKVPSYAEAPAMSAIPLTEELIKQIKSQKYDLIVVNFANLDLVGHSADIEATIKATETVDSCLSKFIPIALENSYSLVVNGDHGNAEEMLTPEGEATASHSMNPTQVFVITQEYKAYSLKNKNHGLSDIAPTLLDLMNVDKPETMTGQSLIKLKEKSL